jgi:hypothetical protein
MKNPGNWKLRYKFFPSIPTSLGFSPLIEKIYSKIKCRFLPFTQLPGNICNNAVTEKSTVKTVTQPFLDAEFANNYYIQIIETGFAEQF